MKLAFLLLLLLIPSVSAGFPEKISQNVAQTSLEPNEDFVVDVDLIDGRGRSVGGQVSVFLFNEKNEPVLTESHKVNETLTLSAPQEPGTYILRSSFASFSDELTLRVLDEEKPEQRIPVEVLLILLMIIAIGALATSQLRAERL